MELSTWVVIALVLLVLILLTDIAQLWWVAGRSNPDRGPRSREQWERTTAGDLLPGDVVLASVLSAGPETVVGIETTEGGALLLRFRSGRSRTTPTTTPVRRHRPAEPAIEG